MNKEIKLNSVQGGAFTSSQNRISFEIPNDAVYDLSESHINLNFRIDAEENETGSGVGIYCVGVNWDNNSNANPPNSALVKNCSIRSARNGNIENIRRSDLISTTIRQFNKTVLQIVGDNYKSFSQQPSNINEQNATIYQNINKVGQLKSEQNTIPPVKIPLSDLFDFCNQAVEIDTTRTGVMTIECELNVDKLITSEPFREGEWLPEWTEEKWASVTVEGEANSITTTFEVDNLNQSPLWVGKKIKVSATGAGGASPVVAVPAVISSIVWNTNGTMTVEFENKWGDVGTGESFTNIKIEEETLKSSDLSVDFGELVLKKLAKEKSDFSVIEYSTFSTEQGNGNALEDFQRQYQIEAEADAVVIGFFDETLDGINSLQELDNYRLRLNNIDLTDRDVSIPSPLYFDRLNMAMSQMKIQMRNTTLCPSSLQEKNLVGTFDIDESATIIIASPLNQTTQEKLLQVNIKATQGNGGINNITLFKHLPRRFEY